MLRSIECQGFHDIYVLQLILLSNWAAQAFHQIASCNKFSLLIYIFIRNGSPLCLNQNWKSNLSSVDWLSLLLVYFVLYLPAGLGIIYISPQMIMESSTSSSFFVFQHVWYYLKFLKCFGIFPCKQVEISNGLIRLEPLTTKRIFAINLTLWTFTFGLFGFVAYGCMSETLQTMGSLFDLLVINLVYLPLIALVILITLKNFTFKNDLMKLQDIYGQIVPEDLKLSTHLKPVYGLFAVFYVLGKSCSVLTDVAALKSAVVCWSLGMPKMFCF